jgi:hypothetical protein
MKLVVPTLGTYKLTIISFSLCIVPLINMKWPSLSLITNLGLISSLSDLSIATPACFGGSFAWKIFFYLFTPSQCLFLSMRYVSYTQ